jgi:DNA-binding transcriptional ArsR family regulator
MDRKVAVKLFKEYSDLITVGMSIASFDTSLVKAIEPNAPPPMARWEALDQMHRNGIRHFVSFSPTYPTMDREDLFDVGATPYYVLEPQTGEESIDDLVMQLPTPKQPLTFEIDGLQRDVLTTVGRWDEEGRRGVIYREIGEELGEAAQKISYHVNRLDEQGLLETENDGRSKRVYLTDMGRLYLSWTS